MNWEQLTSKPPLLEVGPPRALKKRWNPWSHEGISMFCKWADHIHKTVCFDGVEFSHEASGYIGSALRWFCRAWHFCRCLAAHVEPPAFRSYQNTSDDRWSLKPGVTLIIYNVKLTKFSQWICARGLFVPISSRKPSRQDEKVRERSWEFGKGPDNILMFIRFLPAGWVDSLGLGGW